MVDNSLDYTANLLGETINETNEFSDTTDFSNLAAGIYTLCFTATNGITDYREQCFDIVISEPEELIVATTLLSGTQLQVNMSGGSLYNVALNGVVSQTAASQIILDLQNGENTLVVTTNLPCQGSFTASFENFSEPILYPNPVFGTTHVSFNANDGSIVGIEIFTADGKLVRKEQKTVFSNGIELNVDDIAAGLYYVRLVGQHNTTFKMLKR